MYFKVIGYEIVKARRFFAGRKVTDIVKQNILNCIRESRYNDNIGVPILANIIHINHPYWLQILLQFVLFPFP